MCELEYLEEEKVEEEAGGSAGDGDQEDRGPGGCLEIPLLVKVK